jgi:hypothetical protein
VPDRVLRSPECSRIIVYVFLENIYNRNRQTPSVITKEKQKVTGENNKNEIKK